MIRNVLEQNCERNPTPLGVGQRKNGFNAVVVEISMIRIIQSHENY
jgi:hypothetical protein